MLSASITPTPFKCCWTTHSFLAEHPTHPLGARWPVTLIDNGPCGSPSGTSASQPPQSQHPSAAPWSGHLGTAGTHSQMFIPFTRLLGLFLTTTTTITSSKATKTMKNESTALELVKNSKSRLSLGVPLGA